MPTTLIDDVLHLILQICTISSISTISRVSFHTRELALPHLMRKVYLIHGLQKVVTFLHFIIDNTHDSGSGFSSPGRHVFELELDSSAFGTYVLRKGKYMLAEKKEYPVSIWTPMLTRALRLMPNLRSFTMKGDTEEIVIHSPDFVRTLLGLPQLTSLTLWEIGSYTSLSLGEAIDTLKCASTHLRVLDIDVTSDDEEDSLKVVANQGVGQLLSHNCMHLTELYLGGELDLSMFLLEDKCRPDDTRIVFPNVGKLEIGNCDLSLKGFATAFPAMQTLKLYFCMFLRPYLTGPRQDHVSFPNLISVAGCYKDIHALLNCNAARDHVRRVVVGPNFYWVEDNDTYVFAVPKAAPRLKSIHFSQRRVNCLSGWQAFGETLPELSYLEVSLEPNSTDEWDLIRNHIPSAVAPMPLEYISLLIKQYARVLHGPDFAEQPIALSFAKSIPTLKYIDVHKNNLRLRSSSEASITWWKVVREVASDGEVSVYVKSLDANRGKALHDWYDLQAYGGIA